jgi:hypothetical protein
MNKKVLTLLLLLIAVSTIAVVSAADTQTIGNIEFNIPDGYVYDGDSSNALLQAFDEEKSDDTGVFTNDKGESVIIMIYKETPETEYPDDYVSENKTINAKNGTLFSAPSRENILFTYNEGDKIVFIQAMDENILKETIK